MSSTYILSNVLVKMAEYTTCRYGKVGATDFCLCTSRGFEDKRFLTVKSKSKVEKLECLASVLDHEL